MTTRHNHNYKVSSRSTCSNSEQIVVCTACDAELSIHDVVGRYNTLMSGITKAADNLAEATLEDMPWSPSISTTLEILEDLEKSCGKS